MSHNDSATSRDEDQGEWTQIPGVDAPSRESLLGPDVDPPGPFDDADEHNARLMWDYQVRGTLANHPQIGLAGSAANQRFVGLFRTLGSRLADLRTVADFVMIYPPG